MTDDAGKSPRGYRKNGLPYKDGNTRDDGSYDVGKNRPPPETKFQKEDGRRRGRRTKGVRNHDTEFAEELNRKTRIKENGKECIVSKGLAVDLRLIDNAANKGQNRAIELVEERRRRIAEKNEANARYHSQSDREILRVYLEERRTDLRIDPQQFGDPAPEEAVDDPAPSESK